MTGYATASANLHGFDIAISMSSVNSRGLDIRLRMPSGFEKIEKDLRQIVSNQLNRGSIAISLSVKSFGATSQIILNEKALDEVLKAIEIISEKVANKKLKIKPARIDGLLGIKNVVEQKDNNIDENLLGEISDLIILTSKSCLNDLLLSRQIEGEKLKQVILQRISEIEILTKKADENLSRNKQVILQKLKQQISDLMADNSSLNEDRLNQEALLLATKADIREELDRLYAHVLAAKTLIEAGGVIGRKLDFLAQEFNREANTLCAKSNSIELTQIGMDIKVAIDQLREQVQNIE